MARLRKATTTTPVKNTGSKNNKGSKATKLVLKDLMEQEVPSGLVLDLSTLELKPSARGRVGFKASTLDGKRAITWWKVYDDGATWEDLISDNGDGTASVKAGVRVTDDGGLIPPSAPVYKGFWS